MHSAPSVSYPVRRSRDAARLLWVVWAAGACCAGLTCCLLDRVDWRAGLLLASSVLAAMVSRRALGCAGPRYSDRLVFDGKHWVLPCALPVEAGRLAVGLDFQALLLIRFDVPGRGARWLWLERRARPERWQDVRRAVYARAPSAGISADAGHVLASVDAPPS